MNLASSTEILVGTQPARGFMTTQRILSGHQGANAALRLFGRGRFLMGAWCGPQSSVEVWQVEPWRTLQNMTLEVQLADMAAGGERVQVAPPGVSGDRSDWAPHLVPVMDAAVSVNGDRMLIAGGRGVRILELDGQQVQWKKRDVYRGHQSLVTACAMNTDGELSLSADQSGTVLVWGTDTSREALRLKISTIPHCAQFIWQDHLAAVGDDRGRVICWDLAQGRRHLQFQAHRGPVQRMHFDSASGCLVTTGVDNCARLWNLERGQQVGPDLLHSAPVYDAVIAGEGRFVVTGSADGYVAVWSAVDGLLLDWFNDGAPVYRVSYDDVTGAVVVAGARTVKLIHCDWIRLRELSYSQSRASAIRLATSGYGMPPAAVAATYAGQAMNAPVGSVMAARQTSELPMPEQSNARIDRSANAAIRASTGSVPAIDTLRAPPPRAPSTQAMSAIPGPQGGGFGAAPGNAFGAPASAPFGGPAAGPSLGASAGSPSFGQAAPANPFQMPAAAPFGAPPAAAAAPVPFGAPAAPYVPPAASPFQPPAPAAPAPNSFADGFFDGAEVVSPLAQPASAPVQPSPTQAFSGIPQATRKPNDEPATMGTPAGHIHRPLDDLLENEPKKEKPVAVVEQPPFPAAAAGIVFLLAAVIGFGAQAASRNYYTYTGIPAGMENRHADIDMSYTNELSAAEAEFEGVRAAREAQIASTAQDVRLPPSEVERLQRRYQAQIEEARRAMEERQAAAAVARENQINNIQGERAQRALEGSYQHGGMAGGLAFLLGLMVVQITEKRKAQARDPRAARTAAANAKPASRAR